MEVVVEKQKVADVVSAFSFNLICFNNKKCRVKI